MEREIILYGQASKALQVQYPNFGRFTHLPNRNNPVWEGQSPGSHLLNVEFAEFNGDAPVVFILRAVPSAGKTTVARRIVESGYANVMCAADDYFTNDAGIRNFDMRHIGAAHTACKANVELALIDGYSVVVHNTNVVFKEYKYYVELARQYHASLVVINVVVNHNGRAVDAVPEVIIERKIAQFSYDVDKIAAHYSND